MVLAACTPPLVTQHLPSSLQEAASVHVAVLSVARWSEYESVLQPDMSVTIDDAEKMAIPVTSDYVRNVYDALNGKLNLGWEKSNGGSATEQAGTTGATGSGGGNSGSNTGSSSGTGSGTGGKSTKKNVTGAASGASAASDASGASSTSDASAPSSASDSGASAVKMLPIQTNPLLQHQLALSIFQEMQILSHYLKDAAFKTGWDPYIVRAQVSVSPYAHNQPFDVYVDLGLFSKCLDHDNNAYPDSERAIQPALVIPLLVTDTVEAQQASNTAQLARDLALGVGGNIGNVALQSDLEKVSKNLQSLLGTDYNSLYMVSRVSDSVMQVRLGAPFNAMSQYSMSTVTHNVTLVVLTPPCKEGTDHTQLNVATVSRLRNAVSGQLLGIAPNYGFTQAQQVIVRAVGESFLNSPANNPKDVGTLIREVRSGDYGAFVQSLEDDFIKRDYAQYLWTALGDVGGTTEFSVAYVDLPGTDKGYLAPTNQIVYFRDGTSSSTATVGINPELVPATQSAQLQLGNGNVVLVANSIKTIDDGRTLEIQFPPLAPLKSMPGNIVPAKTGPLHGTLVLQPEVERWDVPKAATVTGGTKSTAAGDGRYVFSSLLYEPVATPPKNASSPGVHKPVRKTGGSKDVQPVAGTPASDAVVAPGGTPLPSAPPPTIPPHAEQNAPAPGHHDVERVKPDQRASPTKAASAG